MSIKTYYYLLKILVLYYNESFFIVLSVPNQAPIIRYVRPEILGFILGEFILSVANKKFAARGRSSPLIRFCLGFIVMIGALMFLGCPTRMVLRLAGGDFNAILGLLDFASGIFAGIFFLNRGFTLKINYKLTKIDTRGLSCPQSVLLTKKGLKNHPEGVEVIVDNITVCNNVQKFIKNLGYNVNIK